MAEALDAHDTPLENRRLILEVMAAAGDPLPEVWAQPLAAALSGDDEALLRSALLAARNFAARPPRKSNPKEPSPPAADYREALVRPLRRLAADEAGSAEQRVAAAAALAPIETACDGTVFAALENGLAADDPLVRWQAAQALAASALSGEQLWRLALRIDSAGPLELPALLAAFGKADNEALGLQLVRSLDRSPVTASLRADSLRDALRGFPSSVQSAAEPLLARSAAALADRSARLAELRSSLAGGDVQRGRNTFFSAKALCSACHTVQGQGGKIGPDLSAIGAIRSPDDLLEAVIYPSASFARGFEPFAFSTRDGLSASGIVARQSADAVYLVNADRREVTIRRTDIESIEPASVSIMPDGIEKLLTVADIADLVAFLSSLK